MGIKQLSQLIKDNCKKGIKEHPITFYSNKKICIDASMFIYQFLIAVRSDGNTLGVGDTTTSHLIGLFYRTIRIVESGIIPIYIFDGKPPELKMYELKKRMEKREKADTEYKIAQEANDKEMMLKQEKRKVKVTDEHVNDCKKLLKLMGIPYMTAPSEAEAFCAYLNKKGLVYGVATEDMDSLTFGCTVLLRNFASSPTKKLPIIEYRLSEILKEIDLNMNQFIDLCILLGCDYCDTIKGIGLKKALVSIKKYGSIEEVLKQENVEDKAFDYEKAREIFKTLSEIEVEINPSDFTIKWDQVNLEKIKEYLVKEKEFDEARVEKSIEKYMKCKAKKKQVTLDSFFSRKK